MPSCAYQRSIRSVKCSKSTFRDPRGIGTPSTQITRSTVSHVTPRSLSPNRIFRGSNISIGPGPSAKVERQISNRSAKHSRNLRNFKVPIVATRLPKQCTRRRRRRGGWVTAARIREKPRNVEYSHETSGPLSTTLPICRTALSRFHCNDAMATLNDANCRPRRSRCAPAPAPAHRGGVGASWSTASAQGWKTLALFDRGTLGLGRRSAGAQMSIYKRGQVYWVHLTVAGSPTIRESANTKDKTRRRSITTADSPNSGALASSANALESHSRRPRPIG